MSTITTRAGKGSPLTNNEVDANFTNLNTDKAELSGAAFTGAITTTSTVDGRDVATDGSKLDGIEAGATADQTAAEIKTAYESNADTNAFTDADESKLDGIEASADVTDTTNVTAAGALMDSELTSIASVKALNQGVATTDSPDFAALNVNGTATVVGTTTSGILLKSASGASSGFKLYNDSGTDTAYLNNHFSGPMVFATNNTERLRISSTGAATFSSTIAATSADLRNTSSGAETTALSLRNYAAGANTATALNFYPTQSTARFASIVAENTDGNNNIALSFLTSAGDTPSAALTLNQDRTATFSSTVTHTGLTLNHNTGMYTVDKTLSSYSATNGVYLNGNANGWLQLSGDGARNTRINIFGDGNASANAITFVTNNTEMLRIAATESIFNAAGADRDFRVESDASTHALFVDAGSEAVGLFTSSPNAPLHVQKSHTSTDVTAANSNATLNVANSGPGNGVYNAIKFSANQQDMYLMSFNNSAQSSRRLGFFVGSVAGDATTDERLSILGNGNIGVNTQSPVNNGTDSHGITINGTGNYQNLALQKSGTTQFLMYLNGTNGVFLNQVTADPMMFLTADTERMRIDSSGNVIVGTTNLAPVSNNVQGVSIRSFGELQSSRDGAATLYLNRKTNDGDIVILRKDGADVGSIGTASSYLTIGSPVGSGGHLLIGNNLVHPATSTGGAKDNAIDIGGSGNRFKDLWVSRTHIANNSTSYWTLDRDDNDGSLTVDDTGTERMRIDPSGNLLVGTTNPSASIGEGIKFRAGQNAKTISTASSQSTSASEGFTMWSTGANTWRFYVGWGGKINATSNTIQAISDQRFKENIRDLDDGLSKVMELRPRKFDWKEGKGADIKDDRGFIAQEFEEVFPDLVGEWKDEAPEGEEPYKAVSQDLIPTLVKAIQEQQTLIESLTTRIAALEE